MVILLPKSQEVSLYLHIPFCTTKCPYCHFYVLPNKEPLHRLLLEGLKREIDLWKPQLESKNIVSIYFGGGTPSLLGAQAIETILQSLPGKRDIEITLEANPENMTKDVVKSFADAGINRLSFGIQSLDDEHLKDLGRKHSAGQAIEAVESAFLAGISNITVDLMYELPDQDIIRWQNTLKRAAELPITHLSLYNLTIEPNTVFDLHREALETRLPQEGTRIAMYEQAIETLENAGLKQYEISAFARSDHYSRHNTGYWTGRPFLGFGPSAFSYWEGKRFRNISNLSKYHDALMNGLKVTDFEEKLTEQSRVKELLVIQLRLRQGVDLEKFQQDIGKLEQETYLIISNLKLQGLLVEEHKRIKLTKQGLLLYDSIASLLI